VSRACLLWAAALSLTGCCITPPPAAKYFDRESPEETFKGFVYAVDTHQWDYAYESLSESTQEKVGRLRFEVGIRFWKDPVFDVPIIEIVSNSVFHHGKTWIEGGSAKIAVVSTVCDIDFGATLFFVKTVDDEWRFDFLRTVEEFQQRIEEVSPSEDITRA